MSSEQAALTAFERDEVRSLDSLTDAEREVYDAVNTRGFGVREYVRRTDRSPGTVGNLLGRAREKLDTEEGVDV